MLDTLLKPFRLIYLYSSSHKKTRSCQDFFKKKP